jgi:phage terminase large subunit GpA-like protein
MMSTTTLHQSLPGLADAFDITRRAARAGARPDPKIRISDWADQYRVLTTRSSPEPGIWRTSRTPFLKDIMDSLMADSKWERVVFMKGSQVGAPLALDTPVPTVNGWTTMADIRIGDQVFDENGAPCWVWGASPVFEQRDCYRVQFSDGCSIVADSSHLWSVWDDLGGSTRRHRRILTTADMLPQHKRRERNRYAIDVTGPLTLPSADLPIDPYLLGYWLGNGSACMNHLTLHEDDGEEIAGLLRESGRGIALRHPDWLKGKAANILIDGRDTLVEEREEEQEPFGIAIRSLNLFRNKHIPVAYLRASMSQRLALLQGLMDSDGHVGKNGRCEYSTITPELRDGCYELLVSLGFKPTVAWRPAKSKTIGDRPVESKPYWRLSFLAYAALPVFRLSRKRKRLKVADAKCRVSETCRRRIVAIEPVASEPVRCIAVTSESNLFLAGRGMIPTHNTESGNNWIGYIIHLAPGPMLVVQPTETMAKRNSKQRIGPLIEDCPVLRSLVRSPRMRDSGNTILAKEFLGGILVLAGANSAKQLRSMAVRYLMLDEVDAYPPNVDREGEPCDLAIARTSNFRQRKIFIASTPTIAGRSRIEQFFASSDQCYFFVPCPRCGKFITFLPEQLGWSNTHPHEAAYRCQECEREIFDHEKTKMLDLGEWHSTAQGDGITRGYHLSSYYSPVGWLSWTQIMRKRDVALTSPEKLQTFYNTILGVPWADQGEVPDVDRLYERRENYVIGEVPEGGLILTAGADVQRDRIECEIVAWGRDRHSWSIDYRVYEGNTNQPEVWMKLAALLDEDFPSYYGAALRIKKLAVDSGFNTLRVYQWARQMGSMHVMAVKGENHTHVSAFVGAPTLVDVTPGGRMIRGGVRLWPVNTSVGKEELYRSLRLSAPDLAAGESWPAGYCHFPNYGKEFFEQLCAEQLITHTIAGRTTTRWEKRRDRNEALDIRVYARAAAAVLRIETWPARKWDDIEASLRESAGMQRAPTAAALNRPRTPMPQFRPMKANESFLE